ncbi:MAG: hypothetical protein JSU74_00185 [Candidatus Zixiibacteriota bacterium]|nr:MAG: hypothetical protein JSU74_00185 [candidate division Zixibacteria bacterium]
MRNCSPVLLTLTLLLFSATDGLAGKKDRRPTEKTKQANVRPISGNFALFFTGGIYLGEHLYEMRIVERMICGGGISLDVYPHPRFAFGLGAEGAVKISANRDDGSVGGFLWSGNFSYNLLPLRRTIPYAKVALGYATIQAHNHAFIRLGLGLFRYTGSYTTTRFEAYYCAIDSWGRYVGIQLGFGFPL